ncbi:MAG: TrkA family potassium uptake protein [Verrucomicrobiota bacterium]|nr:TrkA family potassium uptake protein [Verrucomicrobiota bacterium]
MKIGVVGCGRFGSCLAVGLARKGADVVVLDRSRDVVQRMSDVLTRVTQGDATDESVLREAGFADCETVVVAIGANIEGSILAAMTLKEMKIPRIMAKAVTDLHGKVLDRIGVNRVIHPDRDMADRLASLLTTPSLLDYVEITEGAAIADIRAPESLIGKTLADSKLRRLHGVIVLAIEKGGAVGAARRIILVPQPKDTIETGDVLVVFGPEDKLKQLYETIG